MAPNCRKLTQKLTPFFAPFSPRPLNPSKGVAGFGPKGESLGESDHGSTDPLILRYGVGLFPGGGELRGEFDERKPDRGPSPLTAWPSWTTGPSWRITRSASATVQGHDHRLRGGSVEIGSGGSGTARQRSRVGLVKTEMIRQDGPWRGLEEVEYATLEWVHDPLAGTAGLPAAAEYEARFHRTQAAHVAVGALT